MQVRYLHYQEIFEANILSKYIWREILTNQI